MIKKLSSIFVLLFLFGCNKPFSVIDPDNLKNCVGTLSLHYNFVAPTTPQNIKVSWNGVDINECTGENLDLLNIERLNSQLSITESEPLKTFPQDISITVTDLGDCSINSKFFELANYRLSDNEPTLCESFDLNFNE